MTDSSASSGNDTPWDIWPCAEGCGKTRTGDDHRAVFTHYLKHQWDRGLCPDREISSFCWRCLECSAERQEGFSRPGVVDVPQEALDEPEELPRAERDYPEGWCPQEGRVVEPWEFNEDSED